jgi:hypothetical protein
MQHSIYDLRYRLTPGHVELEPLRVLACRTAEWIDWRVTFHVLGASHAVVLERGGQTITELLTCRPAAGASNPLLDLACDDSATGCATRDGIECRVRISPMLLGDGDDLRTVVEPGCRMDYSFPARAGEQAPMTRIGWRVDGRALRVETVHTYPEAGRGVRSETVFIIGEEAEKHRG